MPQVTSPLLEELSQPSAAVLDLVAKLQGPLLLLGAGGKIGHSLARMVQRATQMAGRGPRVIAVSRFGSVPNRQLFERDGIKIIATDLSRSPHLQDLPDAENIIYLVGHKFGSGERAPLTWLSNAFIPGLVCQRFSHARFVVMSSGNVYPLTGPELGGCSEDHPVAPIGEYAQSVLARERIFQYFSAEQATPSTVLRLNYANEPRYGVLVDLAKQLLAGDPIELAMGHVNLIWQSDCNLVTLLALQHASSPPSVINLAGPQCSIQEVAQRLALALGVQAHFTGQELPTALLSNGARCWKMFGQPLVDLDGMIRRVAEWLKAGGETVDKPTKYYVRDGIF